MASDWLHELKHGVPADLRRVDGSGFALAPPRTEMHTLADALADVVGNLVGVCSAAEGAARDYTEHCLAYVLALYGAEDHETAAHVVRQTMTRYCRDGSYDVERITDALVDHVW
jgi:hypothetical protein